MSQFISTVFTQTTPDPKTYTQTFPPKAAVSSSSELHCGMSLTPRVLQRFIFVFLRDLMDFSFIGTALWLFFSLFFFSLP